MTAAQKLAKEKFKKAIAIRSKTGVSLKEAFAQVYGKKKVGAVKKKAVKKKVVKKAAKKVVKKAAPKKIAKKVVQKSKPRYSAKEHKNWGIIPQHRRRVNGVKTHKDTKSHNVNIRVVSGLPNYKNAVRVYFSNPKYNYTTTVGANVTEEIAKKYFLGKFFNVGVYPKEILQKPTRIKFFRYIDK